MGTVIKSFNISEGHYGLDIASVKNSVITCIADGVVIFSGYLAGQGNVIIIQHPGNLISVYKRNASLLKKTGTRVRSGEPR